MAESRDCPSRRTLSDEITPRQRVLQERSVPQEAKVWLVGPTRDVRTAAATLRDLQERLRRVSALQSLHASRARFQFFGHMLQGFVQGDISRDTNAGDWSVNSVRGSSGGQNDRPQSSSGISEECGRGPRADVFLRILKHLNLQQFEQPFRRAWRNRHVPSATQRAIKQDLDVQEEAFIKKMSAKKLLDDDVWKLVEEAFLALIRNDETEKSTFNFINAYNDESVTLPSSFYSGRRRLKKLAAKFWINYLLEVVAKAADRHRDDNCNMKRILARVCGVLSKKLQEQYGCDLRGGKFDGRAVDLLAMASDFVLSEKFIHAVLTFCTAAELHKLENNGDESVNNVSACVDRIFSVIVLMTERSAMVIDHVIPLMKQMRSHLLLIENATKVVRVRNIALCSCSIASSYFVLCRYQQCSSEMESAIDHIERELGREAQKFKVYGFCLSLAAQSSLVMGDSAKASELVKLALKAYEKAEDWKNGKARKDVLESMKKNLEMLKMPLKK